MLELLSLTFNRRGTLLTTTSRARLNMKLAMTGCDTNLVVYLSWVSLLTISLMLVLRVSVVASVIAWEGLLLVTLMMSDLERMVIAEIGLIISRGEALTKVQVTSVSGT